MIPAIPDKFADALYRGGMIVRAPQEFGPQGFMAQVLSRVTGTSGSVIVTQAEVDGEEWLHASLAWSEQDPSYAEMHALHLAVFGRRRWSYQVNAPTVDHVNIHEHALHLFGRVDGKAMLPDFTQGSGSI